MQVAIICLTLLATMLLMSGCQSDNTNSASLIESKKREPMLPFEGQDLLTGEQETVAKEAEGRVRMLLFFSLG